MANRGKERPLLLEPPAAFRDYQVVFYLVFEFKLDGTVEEALAQIDDRGYLIPYSADGRELVKVGVEFIATERNIGTWKVNA